MNRKVTMFIQDLIDSEVDTVQAILESTPYNKASYIRSVVYNAVFSNDTQTYKDLLQQLRQHVTTPPTHDEYIEAFRQSSIVTSVNLCQRKCHIKIDTIFGILKEGFLFDILEWLNDMEQVYKQTHIEAFKAHNPHMTRQKVEEMNELVAKKCVSYTDFLHKV